MDVFEKQLEKFISDLDSMGILTSDFEELDDDEVLAFTLDDIPYDAVLEINKKFEYINVYCSFSYYDIPKSSISHYEIEEIEEELQTFYLQKRFEKAFRKSLFEIEVWDDGCYMCHGYNARVGFCGAPCLTETVQSFVRVAVSFFENDNCESLIKAVDNELSTILPQGRNHFNSEFKVQVKEEIDFSMVQLDDVKIYEGKEFVLFRKDEHLTAIVKDLYNLLLKIINDIEYFSDVNFELIDTGIQANTRSFVVEIAKVDYKKAIDFESVFYMYHAQKFKPFITKNNATQIVNSLISPEESIAIIRQYLWPHIYTEGHTDWRHIKHAFSSLKLQSDCKWVICEYDHKVNIGDKELLSMCRLFSKDFNTHPKIMIFDRDNCDILSQIEENTKGFRDWGNRVYSFAIPVPVHRQGTPKISIEHYYSDAEIFREHEINGISRRLYMGLEFDSIGRAPSLNKICRMTNKCGQNNISIIDGEVYDSNNSTATNYALSKMSFATIMEKGQISSEAKDAFLLLFNKIENILNYDAKKKNQ